MYFPLLRGKQYELLGLKEFAEKNSGNKWLFPIIEPVRVLPDALLRTAGVLSRNSIPYSVILNPERGDFAIPTNRFAISEFLDRFENFEVKPVPAFYTDGKYEEILADIQEAGLQDVMLIFEESFDIEKADRICNCPEVSYIVCSSVDSRSTKRFLKQTGKKIVRLDDNFIVRKPNSAYRGIDEDPYTEECFYYGDDDFYGFSDYCVLPKEFVEGGTTPTAIAIHMTYRKRKDSIWVRHFVSDEGCDRLDVRSKFGSAVEHLVTFYSSSAPQTDAAQWIIDNSGSYPGLGVLKKITMLNHIQLITNILAAL